MISEKDILPAADLPRRPASRFDTLVGVARDSESLANFAVKDLPISDAAQAQIELLVAGQQTSAIYADTLAELQATPGAFVGQGAFVANGAGAGQYRWTGSAWQFLRADMLASKADVGDVDAVRLDTGSEGDLINTSMGTTAASSTSGTAGYVLANATPIPYRALVTRVSGRFRDAGSGEIHVLSPRPEGGTFTAAIYLMSRPAAGVAQVVLNLIVEAGSFIAYKPVTGPNIAFDQPGGTNLGTARWLAADSVSVGDIQGAPVISATTIRLGLLVEYGFTGRDPLDLQLDRTTALAAAAEQAARKAAEFLDLNSVSSEMVVAGSITDTYTANASALYGYGPVDGSPGGSVLRVQAIHAGAGTAIIEAQDADRVVIARTPVPFVDGVNTWVAGVDFPQVQVPAGGHVYVRVSAGNNVRFTSVAGQSFSTAGSAQATGVGQVQDWTISPVAVAVRVEYEALTQTLAGMIGPAIAPALIDESFDTGAPGWTLAGAAVTGARLVSADSASWANRCYPSFYGKSQLMRRSLSAFGEISAAGQVWGIGFIRDTGGTVLDTPLAIVDGSAAQLRVYKWDGTTAPTVVAAQASIPWTLAGSKFRLDMDRAWFSTTITLTNLVSGQEVQIVLDYVAGTGRDTGRPWGSPCIVFPHTAAGGVYIDRFRMVADYPFPGARPARVLLIGDSITEGSQIGGTPNPEHDRSWSFFVEADRAGRGAKDTAVMARGGQRSSHVLNAISEAVALCDKDTVVIMLMGTNDAIGNVSVAAWRSNMTSLLSSLKTRTKRIALGCLPPITPAAAARRAQYNADILAGYFGVDLLPPVRFDLALSANNDGATWNAALQVGDNIHPNVAGNAVMLARVRLDVPEAFE